MSQAVGIKILRKVALIRSLRVFWRSSCWPIVGVLLDGYDFDSSLSEWPGWSRFVSCWGALLISAFFSDKKSDVGDGIRYC